MRIRLQKKKLRFPLKKCLLNALKQNFFVIRLLNETLAFVYSLPPDTNTVVLHAFYRPFTFHIRA